MSTLAWPLEGSRVVVLAPGDAGEASIVRLADNTVVGGVGLRVETNGALFIAQLCIDPEHRGYGLGSEAARLVLDAAAAAGYDEIRAWAPPDLGLAVYFWFRMGLRPVFGAGHDGGLDFKRVAVEAPGESQQA